MKTGERILNKRSGMTGLCAIHFSMIKKMMVSTPPAKYSPMTIPEFQGYVMPPHSVGKSNAITDATIKPVPIKSTFFNLCRMDDFGCGKCRKKKITPNAIPP